MQLGTKEKGAIAKSFLFFCDSQASHRLARVAGFVPTCKRKGKWSKAECYVISNCPYYSIVKVAMQLGTKEKGAIAKSFLFFCDSQASHRLARVAGFVPTCKRKGKWSKAECYVISNCPYYSIVKVAMQLGTKEKGAIAKSFLFFCDSQASHRLARVAGFEPADHGVRIRCLTAWRYPNNVKSIKLI